MKKPWLIPSMLGVTVLMIVFLVLSRLGESLAVSAQILFSALLVVTSFFLVRGQQAFNKYVKDRDDPYLVPVGLPYCRIREDSLLVTLTFLLINPAPTAATLWEVHIENSELRDESWKLGDWHIKGITDGKLLVAAKAPAVVIPNKVTNVQFSAIVSSKATLEEARNIERLKWRFIYQIGDYKRKATSYERDVATKKQ